MKAHLEKSENVMILGKLGTLLLRMVSSVSPFIKKAIHVVTYPVILLAQEAILVTVPDKLDAVLDSRLLRVLVLEDGNLEPSPVAGKFIIAFTLITGLGYQPKTMDSLDSVCIEGLADD